MSQCDPDVTIVLVGTKKDLESERMVTTARAQQFMKEKSINFFFETSAKSGENVEEVFITAAKILYYRFREKFDQMKEKMMAQRAGGRGKKLTKKKNSLT